jgi:DNA repair protein RecO (recombination protein O)
VDAIVVGRSDLGESDRIIRLLTETHGRVSAVARGARRSKKRFAGSLDPGTRLTVTLRKGRGELATLTQATVRRAPNRARTDLYRIAAMLYGCELTAALAPEGGEAERLYRLLDVWLDVLEDVQTVGTAAQIALEPTALTYAGLCPALVHCAVCGEPMVLDGHFDDDAGGALHPWCGVGRRVSLSWLQSVETLRRTPLRDTVGQPWTGSSWLIADFARYHIGHPLKARRLLMDATSGDLNP